MGIAQNRRTRIVNDPQQIDITADYFNKTLNPACWKWWSVVSASFIFRAFIRPKEAQSVKDRDLSGRRVYMTRAFKKEP